MSTNYGKPRITKHFYEGTINVLEKDDIIRVSLFERTKSGLKEIVEEFPRNYFPKDVELKVGDVFYCNTNVSLELVKPRIPTDAQFEAMKRQVKKQIPKGDF